MNLIKDEEGSLFIFYGYKKSNFATIIGFPHIIDGEAELTLISNSIHNKNNDLPKDVAKLDWLAMTELGHSLLAA